MVAPRLTSVSPASLRRNDGGPGEGTSVGAESSSDASRWPWILPGVELFHAGTFREGEFDDEGESLQFDCSPADIATMVRNYKKFSTGERPPLTPGVGVGHVDDEEQLFSDDATLTYGEIVRVWAETREIDGAPTAFLLGDLAIDDETKQMLDRGQLTRVSAEIKESPPDGCDGDGCTLVRCVLLGLAPAGAKRLSRIEPSTIRKAGVVRRMSGLASGLASRRASVQRFGDRVFMFSGLTTGMRLGQGKPMYEDLGGFREDEMAGSAPVTMADDMGDDDMGDAGGRDAALTWLTDNGFDPVALKIDDSTPDEAVAGIVAALQRVVGGEDVTEGMQGMQFSDGAHDEPDEDDGEMDDDQHDFAWEAFTTRKGTIGARGTGEHSGTVYGAKAKRLLQQSGGGGDDDVPWAEPAGEEDVPWAESVYDDEDGPLYDENGNELDPDGVDHGEEEEDLPLAEPAGAEDVEYAELASPEDEQKYGSGVADRASNILDPIAEPVEEIEPESPQEQERAKWKSHEEDVARGREWANKQDAPPSTIDDAVGRLSSIGSDVSNEDVFRDVEYSLSRLKSPEVKQVAKKLGVTMGSARSYREMANRIYDRVQVMRKSKSNKFSDDRRTSVAQSQLIRLTTALNRVQGELAAIKANSQLLSRQQAREQIHTFCDTMVREGKMSPAAAERPSRDNPQGGEDYARLVRALTDPRRLNVVHRFSDGQMRRIPKTVLQVEMETIRNRPAVHRFSERIVGRTAGATADPSKSFDEWSKKHYEAELAKHSKR